MIDVMKGGKSFFRAAEDTVQIFSFINHACAFLAGEEEKREQCMHYSWLLGELVQYRKIKI